MKKLLVALVLFAICQTGNSQGLSVSFAKKEFIATQIVLEDGETINGYIKDFTLPNTIEFVGFNTLESQLKMDRKKFKFKSELDGPVKDLELATIRTITLQAEDTIKFEKLKLRSFNSKLQAVDVNDGVMAPVIKEGIINLYGFRIYDCSPCQMLFVIAYIKKPNEEFAYIPLDINKINLFNMGKIHEKYIRAFEEVGKDCPEYMEFLQKSKALMKDKAYVRELRDQYRQFDMDMKEKLKTAKDATERQKMEDHLVTEYFFKIYLDLINEYAARCGSLE